MRKLFVMIATLLIMFTLTSIAAANTIVPYSDSHFNSLTINLTSTKKTSFQATGKQIFSEIKVTECTLQKKNGSRWENVGSLEAPSGVARNTNFYDETMDYSDDIGSGTYRISATFYADGYTVTRTSNERTYE